MKATRPPTFDSPLGQGLVNHYCIDERGSMIWRALRVLVPAGMTLLVVATSWTDIVRYWKINQLSLRDGHPANVPRARESEVLMTALESRAEWWSRAACSTSDPDLFFPVSSPGPALGQEEQAKALCARCQIQPGCLNCALDAGPVQGIWGGMTEEERRRLRHRNRRSARQRAA